MPNLTEQQTLIFEQLKENSKKLNNEIHKDNLPDSLPIILEYSSAITRYAQLLNKEFRIKW